MKLNGSENTESKIILFFLLTNVKKRNIMCTYPEGQNLQGTKITNRRIKMIIIKKTNLNAREEKSLNYITDATNVAAYDNAKALIKAYDAEAKVLKTLANPHTSEGEDVVFTDGTETLATLKTSKMSNARNFQINVKALYAIWKDSNAREALKDFFKLTFTPLKGYSEKAIQEAETVAQMAQLKGAGGASRAANPETIINRVSESYRVSLKV
jgi:hypothetical protein